MPGQISCSSFEIVEALILFELIVLLHHFAKYFDHTSVYVEMS